MAPVLSYWGFRGLAEQIRLILRYSGADFADKRYSNVDDPEKDPQSWINQKYKLGLDFPNLPYYIDGDVKITQSIAIERYLARKFDLVATTEADRIKQDNLLYVAVDLQIGLIRLAYGPNYASGKEAYLKSTSEILRLLSEHLGEKDYFLSSKLNFVDFHLYEGLSINTVYEPTILDTFTNLRAFVKRIENLPRVKEYLNSPNYVKEAICGPSANWGYVAPK